ncbi:sulfate transporter [Penicillium cinerascens]|uniref:Sulfate transporter n=1 Tax=Penicillium cinerascens TaxID=70096 RepID=A0A9W9N8N1_9EURO|nr:sulfate transporter [Penicillium cinerascens]KAJ5215206.1 sulfate transporter [Penicillium cinerascens]
MAPLPTTRRKLKKAFGFEDSPPNALEEQVQSQPGACIYHERDPTVQEWLQNLWPSWRGVGLYFLSLFPFLNWIPCYNWQWLIGDLISGTTVGAVVIPQSMGYAKLADLPVQYGLYTSFMGVFVYWFFATSKDITIGPVAVMSTLVGTIIIEVQADHPEIHGVEIALAIAIICGAIVTFMGLARLGFVVDFIPLPSIVAFMTGSAVSICSGQVKHLLGEQADFNTRAAAYRVIIDTLKYLPTARGYDAAMGLTALALLYAIRTACNYAARKYPHRAKLFFFLSTLRTAFVLLFYTMISAAVNLHRRDNPAFTIVGHVPRGFQHAGAPKITGDLIKTFAPKLPACVIVLLIEHIAISKSFGRVNHYTIDPSQELIAIGVTNLLGPFVGAYPATGSFSRTAIKSKSGVRTPFAGVITAVIVLVALYALTAVFFYIPKSSLSGVIIHAVGDLITAPNTPYRFWIVSPLDFVIFAIGLLVTIFNSIPNGIYVTICLSIAVLLFRHAKARGHFLGYTTISHSGGPRELYFPLDHSHGSDTALVLQQPRPGVFVYRFDEGFNYPNANHYTDDLVKAIFRHTRSTRTNVYATRGDRPWNDPGPRRGQKEPDLSHLPPLHAIVLDFAAVNQVDVTCIQNLVDVRNQLDRYTAPSTVQWHFANVKSRWTKRALASVGFGYPQKLGPSPSIPVENIGNESSVGSSSPDDIETGTKRAQDESFYSEQKTSDPQIRGVQNGGLKSSRPFFHADLTSALCSIDAILDAGDEEKAAV